MGLPFSKTPLFGKIPAPKRIGVSFNGRTEVSKTSDVGSIPSTPATKISAEKQGFLFKPKKNRTVVGFDG